MKSIKKLIFVMAALAAVFGFVACSNDDDDGPETVAVYKADYSDKDSTDITILTFYAGGSFSVYEEWDDGEDRWSGIGCTGTYTGDVTKNTSATNIVTCTIKEYRNENGNLVSTEDYIKELLGDLATDETVKEMLKGFTRPVTIIGKILDVTGIGSFTRDE